MAKIGEDNGEIVAGTSPRSVLGSWEMGGHGQLQVNHNSSCSQNNDSDSESALNSETDLKYSATRYVIGDTTIEWSRDDPIHSFQRNAGSSRVRVHRTNRTSRRKFLKHNITSNSSHWSISRHLSSNIFAWDENGRQKRQKQGRVTDPLLVFGSDVMLMILYRLDARSLAQSILVSHGWQALAGSDRLWAKKLEELWVGKAHLPRRALQRGLSKLAAYSISILDAKRVCDHLKAVAKFTNIRVVPIVGGIASQKQERFLKQRPHIVVGTPGRLWELMAGGESHLVELHSLSFFVLDEADRMIEKGHFRELQSIIDMLPAVEDHSLKSGCFNELQPLDEVNHSSQRKRRQTFVFSATIALTAGFRKKLKRGSHGLKAGTIDGNLSLATLSERAGVRDNAAIADLTSASIVAHKLEEKGMLDL